MTTGAESLISSMWQAVNELPTKPEFWAAIGGSIVGSIGSGFISFFLQLQVMKRDKERWDHESMEEKKRTMRSMIAKAMQMNNAYAAILDDFTLAQTASKSDGVSIALTFLPMVNLPKRVNYEELEKGLLLELLEPDAFNKLLPIDSVFNGTIDLLDMHRRLRKEFEDMNEVEILNPEFVKIKLTAKNRLKLRQMEMLIAKLEENLAGDFEASKNIVRLLLDVQRRKLKVDGKVNFLK